MKEIIKRLHVKLETLISRIDDLENQNLVLSRKLSDSVLNLNQKDKNIDELPGSSKPQDLGAVSYKDTDTNETVQKTQSIETTASVVTENFQAEDKILPNESPKKQYEFAVSFLKVGD